MSLTSKTLLALLVTLAFLTACGQKGPLYLPGRSSSFESMIPEQQPAEQEQESDEDDDEESDDTN